MGENNIKSRCVGQRTVSTSVDDGTAEFLQEEAEVAGVTVSEFLRRLIDLYEEDRRGGVSCRNCGVELNVRDEVAL